MQSAVAATLAPSLRSMPGITMALKQQRPKQERRRDRCKLALQATGKEAQAVQDAVAALQTEHVRRGAFCDLGTQRAAYTDARLHVHMSGRAPAQGGHLVCSGRRCERQQGPGGSDTRFRACGSTYPVCSSITLCSTATPGPVQLQLQLQPTGRHKCYTLLCIHGTAPWKQRGPGNVLQVHHATVCSPYTHLELLATCMLN